MAGSEFRVLLYHHLGPTLYTQSFVWLLTIEKPWLVGLDGIFFTFIIVYGRLHTHTDFNTYSNSKNNTYVVKTLEEYIMVISILVKTF